MKTIFKIIPLYFYTIVCFAQVGALDTTFGINGNIIGSIADNFEPDQSVLQSNDKIVMLGNQSNSSTTALIIKRLNPDGSLDTSFGNNGLVSTTFTSYFLHSYNLVLQSDDKFVIGGEVTSQTNNSQFLVRYNPNGTLDTSFGTNGLAIIPISWGFNDIAVLSDNSFILVGNATDSVFTIAKIKTNGSLDLSFGTNGFKETNLFNTTNSMVIVSLVDVQSDGKIVASGDAQNANGPGYTCNVRYLANGDLDPTYGTNGIVLTIPPASVATGFATCLKQIFQPDGKLIIVGYCKILPTDLDYHMLFRRINTDGSLDTSYGTNGYIFLSSQLIYISSMLMQPDGKLVFAGGFKDNDYKTNFYIARFNSDGTFDTSFNNTGYNMFPPVTLGEDGFYNSILFQNSKLLAVGYETVSDNVSSYYITRLSRFNSGLLEAEGFAKSELAVSPNPVQNVLSVSNESTVQYELFTILGAKIQAGSLAIHGQLDCSNLAKGMYLLKLNGDNGESKVVKVVKE